MGGGKDAKNFVCECLADGWDFIKIKDDFFEVFESLEDAAGLRSGDVDCSHCVQFYSYFCCVEMWGFAV